MDTNENISKSTEFTLNTFTFAKLFPIMVVSTQTLMKWLRDKRSIIGYDIKIF